MSDVTFAQAVRGVVICDFTRDSSAFHRGVYYLVCHQTHAKLHPQAS
jgi:hypothetical protein